MEKYYAQPRSQNYIKKDIVTKYFSAWAKIIAPKANTLQYIDLFCGRGVFDNGTESTPLSIMHVILKSPLYTKKFKIHFNDMNSTYVSELHQRINILNRINELNYPIEYTNEKITNHTITDTINIPTFSFLDPFGYQGITLDLIKNLTAYWGSDCFLFFNYNRIQISFTNSKVENHMKALFSENQYNILKSSLENNEQSIVKEELFIDAFTNSLREICNVHAFPFRFEFEEKECTSHYLIIISKNKTAIKIAKDIMCAASSDDASGITSYSYIPNKKAKQITFFDSIEDNSLIVSIKTKYSGKKLTVSEIVSDYLLAHYSPKDIKNALKMLEIDGSIICLPNRNNRKKNTMADTVIVSFPN